MHRKNNKNNEEQIITGHPIDGAMGSSGGGRVRKLSVVCLHKNAIVARCILVTILHCETPKSRLSAIYIVSAVGTSLISIKNGKTDDPFDLKTLAYAFYHFLSIYA